MWKHNPTDATQCALVLNRLCPCLPAEMHAAIQRYMYDWILMDRETLERTLFVSLSATQLLMLEACNNMSQTVSCIQVPPYHGKTRFCKLLALALIERGRKVCFVTGVECSGDVFVYKSFFAR